MHSKAPLLKNHNQEQAIKGCLLGTAVGDAMGLSCEGLSKQRLIKCYPKLDQYHFIFGKGMVSDDTEHTCLVAQSLIVSHGDVEQFKKTFAWKLRFWFLGLPAGIGLATLKAILKLWLGFSPDNSGVFSAGNGAAMKVALIGVCFGSDHKQLKQFVRVMTRMTHTDPKAECGALAVALAAHLASLNRSVSPQAYFDQLAALLNQTASAELLLSLIQKTIESVMVGQSTADFAETLGLRNGITGYIYHTVPVVMHSWLSNQADYETAILEIIRCGGDTDTTAAIVGGIIGARVGSQGIPQRWLDDLWEFPRTLNWMEKLAERLNQVCCFNIEQKPLPISIIAIFLRNIVFMLIVLWHGFRRALPPY